MADRVLTIRVRESAARRIIAGLHRGAPEARDEAHRLLASQVSPRWLARERGRVREAIHGSRAEKLPRRPPAAPAPSAPPLRPPTPIRPPTEAA